MLFRSQLKTARVEEAQKEVKQTSGPGNFHTPPSVEEAKKKVAEDEARLPVYTLEDFELIAEVLVTAFDSGVVTGLRVFAKDDSDAPYNISVNKKKDLKNLVARLLLKHNVKLKLEYLLIFTALTAYASPAIAAKKHRDAVNKALAEVEEKKRKERLQKIKEEAEAEERVKKIKEKLSAKVPELSGSVNTEPVSKVTLEPVGNTPITEELFPKKEEIAVQIPLVMTKDMKQALDDLGYKGVQISRMKPAEAWVIIKDMIKAPSLDEKKEDGEEVIIKTPKQILEEKQKGETVIKTKRNQGGQKK